MSMRKDTPENTDPNARSEQAAGPASKRRPFSGDFWADRKGSAIGSGSQSPSADDAEPLFGSSGAFNNADGSTTYQADLRRSGPFAKDKVVAPKASVQPPQNSNAIAQDKAQDKAPSKDSPRHPIGGNTKQRILQLDDFEPQAKAWRRTQKEPVAPRVHPNPTPVIPAKGRAAKKAAQKANQHATTQTGGTFSSDGGFSTSNAGHAAAVNVPPHASSDKPSIVTPLAMIFTLLILVFGGYWYLSTLSQEDSNEQKSASRERQIQLVETMLINLDYKPGALDGKIDASLTDAVKAFQRDSLLVEDGAITPQLIKELEAILSIYEAS